MFKRYGIIVAVLLVMVLLVSGCTQGKQDPIEKLASEAEQETLVYFKSKHCPVCDEQNPVFEEVKEKENENFNFVTVDIDDFKNRDIVDIFNVNMLPTFVVIHKDGSVYTIEEGFRSEVQLTNLLEDAVKASPKGE